MNNCPRTRTSKRVILSVKTINFLLTSCYLDSKEVSIINDTAAGISLLPELGKIVKETKTKREPCLFMASPFNGPGTVLKEQITLILEDKSSGIKKELTFKILPGVDSIFGHDVLLGVDMLEKLSACLQLSRQFSNKVSYNVQKPILSIVDETYKDFMYQTYSDVFSEEPSAVNFDYVRIPTNQRYPIAGRPKRYSAKEAEAIIRTVNRLKARGFIEECRSPWSSNCLIVPKKDGTERLVNNFMALNAVTEPLSYPLPSMEEILMALRGKKYFSTMDCHEGFHQMTIHPEDRDKLAFPTPIGQFRYIKMPMGLKRAPAEYQALMNTACQGLLFNRCCINIDDIIVFGATEEEHDENMRLVMERLREYNIKLKYPKCVFKCPSVEFLGFKITQHDLIEKMP